MMKIVTVVAAAAFVMAAPLSLQAQTAAPAATATAKTEKSKRAVSPGQAAMRERQKKCGAQWKDDKAAGKVAKGQTWPKYWSACNKRLKGAG